MTMPSLAFTIPVAPSYRRICRCCESQASTDSTPKRRLRARVAYDGTAYNGWQFQLKSPTVQNALEKVLTRRMGQPIRVVGASRTDAGVHARGQAVHFDVPAESVADESQLDKLQFVVNQMLPADIRMSHIGFAPFYKTPVIVNSEGSDDVKRIHLWSSMYDAKGKLYSYRFSIGPVLDPMERLYCHREWRAQKHGFCEQRLREAASSFSGTHDFSAFVNSLPSKSMDGSQMMINPVRNIRSIRVISEDHTSQIYRVEFSLDGALYKMIRNIMGTLLAVACYRLDTGSVVRLLENRDRRAVPKSAPAHGLCLEEVFYDEWPM